MKAFRKSPMRSVEKGIENMIRDIKRQHGAEAAAAFAKGLIEGIEEEQARQAATVGAKR